MLRRERNWEGEEKRERREEIRKKGLDVREGDLSPAAEISQRQRFEVMVLKTWAVAMTAAPKSWKRQEKKKRFPLRPQGEAQPVDTLRKTSKTQGRL